MSRFLCLGLAAPLMLAGCASLDAGRALEAPRAWAGRAGLPEPQLALDEAARRRDDERRAELLAGELTEAAAVELALRGSPAARTLLAEGWQLQSAAAARATWPRLTLSFERVVQGDGVALARGLALGLAELITLPGRRAAAAAAVDDEGLRAARELLSLHATVRRQWVRAVAARESLAHQDRLLELAEIGAELARRLQVAGNYSPLQASRESASLAEARLSRLRAGVAAAAEHEALARLLGLDALQASSLRWPAALPALPAAARDEAAVQRDAARERLDLRIAEAAWRRVAHERGLAVAERLDLELSLRRETQAGEVARSRELALTLPAPGEARLRSQAADAALLAAASRLDQARVDAASMLRERLAAQHAAHEAAARLTGELQPLRRSITEQSLLRYNGMLGSVFELLADARSQFLADLAAVEARRDFWLADAALDAAVLGVPSGTSGRDGPATATAAAAAPAGGH